MNIIEKTIGTKIHPALVALVVTICRCGKRKDKRKSFCPHCFRRLTLDEQRDLYQRAGQGYEEAYDRAVEHLEGKRSR